MDICQHAKFTFTTVLWPPRLTAEQDSKDEQLTYLKSHILFYIYFLFLFWNSHVALLTDC